MVFLGVNVQTGEEVAVKLVSYSISFSFIFYSLPYSMIYMGSVALNIIYGPKVLEFIYGSRGREDVVKNTPSVILEEETKCFVFLGEQKDILDVEYWNKLRICN